MDCNYKKKLRRFKMNCVGIDVSKEKSTVCILKPYGEVIVSPYEIKHTEEEMKALVKQLKGLDGETRVVLEATGAYHLPLVTALHEAGIFVAVINPLAMKKYVSTSIRKGKTDKLDSVRIANYGIDQDVNAGSCESLERSKQDLRIYFNTNARNCKHFTRV